MLSQLTDWVIDVIEAMGYLGVALLVAIENLFPPIPSEVVLPFAGVVSRRGDESLAVMVLAATLGSLVGAWVLYGIAAAIGPVRLRALVVRHGAWLRITTDDLDRSEGWFDRHGALAVLIGRCVPLIRSLVSIPAGFRRMPLATFTLYTLLGSLVWNAGLVGAGFLLAEEDRWHRIEEAMAWFQYVVVAAILVAIAWFAWTRFLSPAARRRSA